MFRVLAFAIPLASACAYTPGSFSDRQSFPGARATVGCLDVAASSSHGLVQQGPVIQYTVGNRCDRAEIIDLSSVRARSMTGLEVIPFDPKNELRPLRIEARSVLIERIEYRHVTSSARNGICVDVGRLNGPSFEERWLCQEDGPPPVAVAGGAR